MRLHTTIHLVVVEVLVFVDEGLTYLVVGGIVQVLGLKCYFIDHGKARVTAVNDMLFD